METRLPDRVPLEEVIDKDPQTSSTQDPASAGPSLDRVEEVNALRLNPEFTQMTELLGVEFGDVREGDMVSKIEFLYNWGSNQEGTPDKIDSILAVKNLIKSLGYSFKGKDLVNKLYKYTRLSTDRRRIEKEMSLLHE